MILVISLWQGFCCKYQSLKLLKEEMTYNGSISYKRLIQTKFFDNIFIIFIKHRQCCGKNSTVPNYKPDSC